MMYLPAATFLQSVAVVERYAQHSDDAVIAAIHCCQREWGRHLHDKATLRRLYQALFAAKWSWHYILDLPHDDRNPGVRASYAQIELGDFAKLHNINLSATAVSAASAHMSSFLAQTDSGAE